MIENVSDKFSLYSKYNVLLQTIKDGLILISDRRVKYSNRTFAEMFEYAVDEVTNLMIDDLIAPSSKDMVLERYEKRLRGEILPTQYEINAIAKTGRVFPVLISTGLVASGEEKLEFVIVKDLSEISIKNEELKKWENEFEIIFNNTNVAFALFDSNGTILKINNRFQNLFGFEDEEIKTKNFKDVLFQDDLKKFDSLINDFNINNSNQIRTTIKLLNNRGESFWSDVSISAVNNDNGKEQYFIASLTDVSEMIEIEKRFEQEQNLQQYFMDYVPDSIYFKDKFHRFIKVNKATLNKFGLNSADELIGKTDSDFFDEEHARAAQDDENKIVNDGISIINKVEKEIWANGSVTWASTTKIPLRDEKNIIIGTFGITRDITELKKSEEIRDALYKISNAVTSVPDIQNLYSNIHSIIMGLMKADNFYIAMYDEETDMVSFPYFVDQVDDPPAPRKAGRGLTEYILRLGKSQLIDAETDLKLRASGETSLIGEPTQIWLGVPLKVHDKTIGVIVVQDYNDQTTYGENEKAILTYVSEQIALVIDKKHREQKIIEYSEELKEINASKDKFFSIIAHDLKSPMQGILGLTRMIFEEYDSMNDEEVRSSLEILKDSTETTYKLIENLLDWARLETGKINFQPTYQNMFMIVEDIRMLLNQNARFKNITIRNKVSHGSIVWGDSNLLHSLLQNLISNAIKFTPSGGNIEISEEENGNQITFTVTDNGVGIRKEDFEKLFRVDVSFSTRGTMDERGTGLGLVLCNEITHIHGGKMQVQSEIGKGTKISFSLNKNKPTHN